MTGEIPENVAGVAAPGLESTVIPESVETNEPEGTEEGDKPSPTFTQEELDAKVGKRIAQERRKWEREQAARVIETPRSVPTEPVKPEQFETWEDFAEARAEQISEQKLQQRDIQRQRTEIDSTYEDRAEDARAKYDDFDQIVRNPNLRITNEMAETIKSSDIGPDLAYHLGMNPKEALRIASLSPLQQAREIGKLEVKLSTEPAVKRTTSAPAPINPVSARSTNTSYDTTDPRSAKTMSDSEWITAERNRQMKILKAQHNR